MDEKNQKDTPLETSQQPTLPSSLDMYFAPATSNSSKFRYIPKRAAVTLLIVICAGIIFYAVKLATG